MVTVPYISCSPTELRILATDGSGLVSEDPAILRLMKSRDTELLQESELSFRITEDDGLEEVPYRQVGYVALKSARLGAIFMITDGDPEGVFDIDASTGLISTK